MGPVEVAQLAAEAIVLGDHQALWAVLSSDARLGLVMGAGAALVEQGLVDACWAVVFACDVAELGPAHVRWAALAGAGAELVADSLGDEVPVARQAERDGLAVLVAVGEATWRLEPHENAWKVASFTVEPLDLDFVRHHRDELLDEVPAYVDKLRMARLELPA